MSGNVAEPDAKRSGASGEVLKSDMGHGLIYFTPWRSHGQAKLVGEEKVSIQPMTKPTTESLPNLCSIVPRQVTAGGPYGPPPSLNGYGRPAAPIPAPS
jgi:hypothetical protein